MEADPDLGAGVDASRRAGPRATSLPRLRLRLATGLLEQLRHCCRRYFSSPGSPSTAVFADGTEEEGEEGASDEDEDADAERVTSPHPERVIRTFVAHFLPVQQFVAREHLFEEALDQCLALVAHLIQHGWARLLNEASLHHPPLPGGGALQGMGLLVQLLRIFSRLGEWVGGG